MSRNPHIIYILIQLQVELKYGEITRISYLVQPGEWGAGGGFVPLVTPVAGTGREGSG